jgi:hypothetical protein
MAIVLREQITTARDQASRFHHYADNLHTIKLSDSALLKLLNIFFALEEIRMETDDLIKLINHGG